MATNNEQIERIKKQIQIYELMLKQDPDNKALIELLDREIDLLKDITKN